VNLVRLSSFVILRFGILFFFVMVLGIGIGIGIGFGLVTVV